ncbi:Dihydrolipoyllysine-residue acetyltransferase component 4 [Porphyridium purpureum]|uniref:Dihydrolipoamide acetyltransferase component of pyruvate dehydrogenase complex n=1 Tax=Porphyridium purpureum TaxID=35688 RepID=A0A5J4YRE7_PORPP|nr:Dihydrolipoyllysine-residue acetyltransferase component 4 [Porphyridium purpureum]|eukprot:POR1509..scf222_8
MAGHLGFRGRMAFVWAPCTAVREVGAHGNAALRCSAWAPGLLARVVVAAPGCGRRGACRSGRSAVSMQIVDEAMLLEIRAREVFMPALSSTMTEGKIVQWLKAPGDKVESGDIVMVVESDKADMDVECFEDGWIADILVPEGGTAPVGSTVALIAQSQADIEKIKQMGIDCIASGSDSRHDGTTAVTTSEHPLPEKTQAAPPAAAAASSLPKPDFAEVFMPALSSTMTEGKIVQWLKSEGDELESGDMVMVVESDKADMDVETFEGGFLAAITVEEGGMAPVGEPVAYIARSRDDIAAVKAWASSQGSGGGAVTAAAPAAVVPAAPVAPAPAATSAAKAAVAVVNTGRIIASPYAKRIAKEKNVDLAYVAGSGPNGRIVAEDVEKAASIDTTARSPPTAVAAAPRADGKVVATPEAKKLAKTEGIDLSKVQGSGNFGRITADDVLRAAGKAPAAAKKPAGAPVAAPASAGSAPAAAPRAAAEMPAGAVAMNGLQKAVVKNMEASLTVPIFRVSYEIKTTALDAMYAKLKPKGVTVSALLAKAVAMVLEKYPILNATYAKDAIVYNPDINVAMAVATPDGGLITPVLKKANEPDLYSLSRTWKGLVKRTMEKKLSPDEYSSGTFYISNLGMFGVDSFDAVLPPGAGSILAVAGSKPVVGVGANGLVNVEKAMKVNITCDHRIIYGAQAAEFLKALADLLENRIEELLY